MTTRGVPPKTAAPPPPPPPRPNALHPLLRELGVTKEQAYALGATALLLGSVYQARSLGGVAVLAVTASLVLVPAPTQESFQPFFKSWFLNKYMAAAGKCYRDYLKRKSKKEDAISAIGTTVTRWFQKATEDLNNTLFYELSVKHALPSANRINILNAFRLVQVNLGSPQRPTWFTFIGAYNMWIWVPLIWTQQGIAMDLTMACQDGGLLNYADQAQGRR
ncbi:unnamed protein product [Amoebophrya sp. A25]|nr:unnamed protein product [Amoebophrya sp. A25]|eukprot:GSA25T00019782001.1